MQIANNAPGYQMPALTPAELAAANAAADNWQMPEMGLQQLKTLARFALERGEENSEIVNYLATYYPSYLPDNFTPATLTMEKIQEFVSDQKLFKETKEKYGIEFYRYFKVKMIQGGMLGSTLLAMHGMDNTFKEWQEAQLKKTIEERQKDDEKNEALLLAFECIKTPTAECKKRLNIAFEKLN